MTETTEDLRSPLQKQEQAEAEAFAALPLRDRIGVRLTALHEAMLHQIAHNAPVSADLVRQTEALIAELK